MIAAIEFYDVVLFVHITAVVMAWGGTYTYPVIGALAKRHGVGDLVALHRFQLHLSLKWITPWMVVVLGAGFYLVIDGPYSFSDGWVGATFAILIVMFGMVGAVIAPLERKMLALAERDLATGTPSAEYGQAEKKAVGAGIAAGLLIIVAIFLMTTKPF